MKTIFTCSVLSSLLLMASCGELGSEMKVDSDVMSGVAATGAPISNGKVEIKGSNGAIVEKITADDGSYSADIGSLSEPYLIRVIAPSGEKYISVASRSALAEGKKINVTPLTHMIVANVFGKSDSDDLFSNFEAESVNYSDSRLKEKKDELLQVLVASGLVGSGGVVPSSIDLLNGDLKAGTSIGVDGLLDVIEVKPNSGTGMEINIKGSATKIAVNFDGTNVVPNLSGVVAAANNQLSAISFIRTKMNNLAALHSSKTVCNGVVVDDNTACDLDNLFAAFAPYFHPLYQEDGNSGDAGVWSWICRGEDDVDVSSRSECIANGSMFFEKVMLKDITLISLNSGVAHISFNFYLNGKLKNSEEMFLKEDGANNFKLLGNEKTFAYWIDTESLHSTDFNMSNGATSNTYDVNLNFHMKDKKGYSFNGSESFILNAASGNAIFPGSATSMNLYLVQGPKYTKSGICSPGLVFSTTATPYKVYNNNNGSVSHSNFSNACAPLNDPCDCRNASGVQAQFDWDSAQKVTLSSVQIAAMNKNEKIILTGPGVSGDVFFIKRPLVINQYNASQYIPSFGMSTANFCSTMNFNSSLNLSVASGTLDHIGLHIGYSDSGSSAWSNQSTYGDLWQLSAKSIVYTPSFTAVSQSDVIHNIHLYMSSRDEHDRRFVRRVDCH